jgi:hypothetical protein
MRYCKPACRQRAWRAQVRQEDLDDRVIQQCDRCGKNLRLTVRRNGVRRLVRRDAKYCSQRCQKQHARHLLRLAFRRFYG